ncbi:unnamed protein product [Urochloa humidicola]
MGKTESSPFPSSYKMNPDLVCVHAMLFSSCFAVEIDLQAGAQYKYKVVLMSCRMPQPACLRKCLQHV